MTLFLQLVLANAVFVAVLAVFVMVITRLARSHQLAHALWVLVLLKLILPPIVTIPLPARFSTAVFVSTEAEISPAELAMESGTDSRITPLSESIAAASTPSGIETVPAPAATGALSRKTADGAPQFGWPWFVMAMWWAGSLVIALVGLIRIRRFARLVADTEAAHGEIQDDADQIARRLGLRKSPDVRLVQGVIPPVVWAPAFHPVILLPERLLSGLDRASRSTILAHELAHVRRRDHWVRRLESLVIVLYWWNPVVWFVLRRLNHAEERCCDAWVDWLVPGSRRAYAEAIMQTVEFLSAARTSVPVIASGIGRSFPLKSRIAEILAGGRTRRLSWPARSALLVATAVGLPLSAVPSRGVEQLAAVGLPEPPAAAPDAVANEPEPDQFPLPVMAEREAAETADVGETMTLTGVCLDEAKQPLPGVNVVLYRMDLVKPDRIKRLQGMATDPAGQFSFVGHRPRGKSSDGRSRFGFGLVATLEGRASQIRSLDAADQPGEVEFTMSPAATLRGRVTDPDGKPVAGAAVWTIGFGSEPVDGVLSAKTDDEGRYAISDLALFDAAKAKPIRINENMASRVTGHYFSVRHPDYAQTRLMYTRVPDTIDVTLRPAGFVTGRVLDEVTGQAGAGVVVSLQNTLHGAEASFRQTTTSADGHYRLTSLAAGSYNLWSDADDRSCAAIDSIQVKAGETCAAPNLRLVEESWLEGRLIDAGTELPISHDDSGKRRVRVALNGPSRPKSGGMRIWSHVDDDGRFRCRVAPGLNFPYIELPEVWNRTEDLEFYKKGIEVERGEVVSVNFRILPKQPKIAPVVLAVPVAAERAAAATIRKLGGWYQVDDEDHVVEVNMVYHRTPQGVRYDNDWVDTDEALRCVPEFPRLKRLFLHKGQATDEALERVAGLADLAVLSIWDAENVSDTGVKNLAGLENLERVHISKGRLGDDSLAVLARLPKLSNLSLNGNSFSDAGLAHLAEMRQLRWLMIGPHNKRTITDSGVRQLAGLSELEGLDLQGSQISDAGIEAIKDLKRLRRLFVGNGRSTYTDASLECLLSMTELEDLDLQGSRISSEAVKRLIGLPKLQYLGVPNGAVTPEVRDLIKSLKPQLQLGISSARTEGE